MCKPQERFVGLPNSSWLNQFPQRPTAWASGMAPLQPLGAAPRPDGVMPRRDERAARRWQVRSVVRKTLLAVASLAAASAAVAAPEATWAAAGRAWPPFVLVVGLLLVGVVAHADGLFDRAAAATGRLGGGGAPLLLALLGLVAVVTAVLNLDTSVAFLTPILVLSARRRGLNEAPFLFGSLVMANAASLLLPGSNLTNLLVLAREHVSGATFAARMLPAWTAAVVVTAAVLLLHYRHSLAAGDGEIESKVPIGTGRIGAHRQQNPWRRSTGTFATTRCA